MADLGDAPVAAHLGPCIRVGCYEFDGPELDDARRPLRRRRSAGTTTWGTPALDLPAAVHAALAEAGVDEVHDTAGCTACDTRWYSHRARGDARPLRHHRLAGGGVTDIAARVAGDPASASRRPAATRSGSASSPSPRATASDAVEAAVAAGVLDVGESYAQELVAKADAVEAPVRWHFIGGLQRNKVRLVAPFVHLWQSVDRLSLAAEIARHAPGAAVLVQVNVSGQRAPGRVPARARRGGGRGVLATSASTCGA